jgi:hypothetical protein
MSDRWLRDVTLFGTRNEVREGLEAWYATGLRTPILVASSTSGGQFKRSRSFCGDGGLKPSPEASQKSASQKSEVRSQKSEM